MVWLGGRMTRGDGRVVVVWLLDRMRFSRAIERACRQDVAFR